MENKECNELIEEFSPLISFKDLDIELCKAKSGYKLARPIFCKLIYEAIPLYYNKWGEIFRKTSEPNIYYSMEEVQELYIKYIMAHGIEPTGEVKEIIENMVTPT